VARKVALQQRDVAVLSLLVERRVETFDFLHETLFPGASRKVAINRLGDLARAGYLERLSVPLDGEDGPMSVYRLGPRAKAAIELRNARGHEAFRGRRFNPTLRESSIDHQVMTNRVGDWLGARLRPEHLLPAAGKGDAFRHRPDATYVAAQADAHGRRTVYLEVDLGHYSRERILGEIKAFLQAPDARAMLLVAPTQERAALLGLWARDVYGDAIAERLQTLTFDEVRAGGYLRPGTEPTEDEIQNSA
jgi:hypothetical protein